MERRTRSRKHQVIEDKVSVKTFANTIVPHQTLKEPERKAAYIWKQNFSDSIKESKSPKSSNKIAVRRNSKRTDKVIKTTCKESTDEKCLADHDLIVGKSLPKRDISNSTFGEETPQNNEKSILSKAVINELSVDFNVPELPTTEEPGSEKNLLLPKFNEKPLILGQNLSTTCNVSDRNVLFEDFSLRSSVNEEDSFLDDIICRSPAKPVPRIEDPTVALDQDLKVFHEIVVAGEMKECKKFQNLPPHSVSTSKSDSVDERNCTIPINSNLKSPIKNDTHHLVKETAQQGLCGSLRMKKTEDSQMSRVPSTKSPDQSKKAMKPPACGSKSSVTICSSTKSHSTHPSYFQTTKFDSDTGATNSHQKVVTKLKTKPNTSTLSVDVFTRLSTGTPRHHSHSSKTNNSTLHIPKTRQLRPLTSSVDRDGISSLNFRTSKEGCSGTPYRQPAVPSNEVKSHTLQKSKVTSNFVKSPPRRILSKNIPAAHNRKQISKHHKTKPLEDINQNSLPRVNRSHDIKTDAETKMIAFHLVRAEAAERGRQAIQEWAEKQMARQ